MKISELKKVLKDVVKEAIQEELKDIIFEAYKSQTKSSPIVEHQNPIGVGSPLISHPPSTSLTKNERMKLYEEALGETISFNTSDVQKFNPTPTSDLVNGTLPPGDVDLDQIMTLMNKK